ACPRCGALHGSDARFCPQCGTQFSGPLAMGEVGGPATAAPTTAPSVPEGAPSAEIAPTPVSGALAGNPPPPAAPAPAPAEPAAEAPTTVMPPADAPRTLDGDSNGSADARPPDQPTQALPAVSSGDPLAPREHPGS